MGIRHKTAQNIADINSLPSSLRAISGYYGNGEISLAEGKQAIETNLHIEDRKEDFVEKLFIPVEDNLSKEFGEKSADFDYDTKLTFPAEITLGKIYEDARTELPVDYNILKGKAETPISEKLVNPFPNKKHRRRREERIEEKHEDVISGVKAAEEFTDLVIGLLVEGDMRDGINDEEYEDFQTSPALPGNEVAYIAQSTLFEELQPKLEVYDDSVREAYERAVDLSMRHQDEDEDFRELFRRAEKSPDKAESTVEPYKNNTTESRFSLDWSDFELPYFATQYERVGVLYDGMFEMYEEAGIDIGDDFKRSLILSTIGAQIWLDDVDDLKDDWNNTQLTPVNAEILEADTAKQAYEEITSIKDQYLDTAREYASRSGSHLAGIGIEYIDREGQSLGLEEGIKDVSR